MRNHLKVFALLFIAGLLVYYNGFNNKFLMDDHVVLGAAPHINMKYVSSLWIPYAGVLEHSEARIYYRPLSQMGWVLTYAAFKDNVWDYHLFNLFLFVLAAFLAYLLISKITGNGRLALLASVFYLIHPINGYVVDYASDHTDIFEVLSILGTILLLWESLERINNRALYFLSLLFSVLSLLWHESGIMTPLYITAVVLLFRNEPGQKKAAYLFPYYLIVLTYIVFRSFFLKINDSFGQQIAVSHMNGGEYLAALYRLFGWYITRFFYPSGIVIQWSTPILRHHIFWDISGAISMMVIFLFLFARFAKEKICRLSLAWILIGFAPVCLAAFRLPYVGAYIELHWFIFSSIGFFILAAYFCLKVLDRMKKAGFVLLFCLILICGAVSHAYNQLWADQMTYARFWSEQAPYFKAGYFYLAQAYQAQGAFKESKRYYQKALEDDLAQNMEIYNNLGTMDSKEGNWQQAESSYRMALKINPSSASIYNNIGFIYLSQGQREKAKEYFLEALAYNPLLLESRLNLAKAYLKDLEYQQAIELCGVNLEIVNNDTDTLLLLIDIYLSRKDYANLKKYAHVLINSNADPEILTRLGVVLAEHNVVDIALDAYIKALQVSPGYKEAYLDAGSMLGNMGKYDEAIHLWRLGLKIYPSDMGLKDSIARAMALKRKED